MSLAKSSNIIMNDNSFICQSSFRLVMFKYFIKSLWIDVPLKRFIFDSKQEVEVVCLLSMFVVAFCYNTQNFAKSFDLFNQSDFTTQVHDTTDWYWF